MHKEVEEQRKWDVEMMDREHNFQRVQMNIIMDGFLKGVEALQQYQHVSSFQPTVHSFPGSSAYSSPTSSSTFMHNPSPLSVSSLLCSSKSSMQPLASTFIPPTSPSPTSSFPTSPSSPLQTSPLPSPISPSSSSLASDYVALWSSSLPSSSQQISLSPQLSSSSIPQNMDIVPNRSPSQTSSPIDKQTK